MNILLVKGHTQYGVLNCFLDQLGDAFEQMGHVVMELDLKENLMQQCVELNRKKIDMAVIMNGMCVDILHQFIDTQHIFVWNFFVDHPIYHSYRLYMQWHNQVSSFIDLDHVSYVNKYFKNCDRAIFLPHGGSAGKQMKGYSDRAYSVVFLGSYYDIEETAKKFGKVNEKMQNVFLTVAERLSLETNTLEELLIEEFGKIGIELTEENIPEIMKETTFLDTYVRNFNRLQMLETLAENQICVDVFGNGWEKYKNAYPEYIRIHPAVSVEEGLNVMADAKIVINNLPLFRKGGHERIFSAMLSGAVCVSEKNEYLSQQFLENEEIVFFEYSNLDELPFKVKVLLEDEALAMEIAQRGCNNALENHTWAKRAQKMIEYYNTIPHNRSQKCIPQRNKEDSRFNLLIQFVENNEETQIAEKIKGCYRGYDLMNYETRVRMETSYRNFPYLGKLSLDDGEFELIYQRAYHLKRHLDDFIWLYGKLSDNTSRKILTNVLYHWVTFNNQYLAKSGNTDYVQYFDYDIIKIDQNDVFVDIGAYNGDTLLSFLDNYCEYKKVICYELDPDNYKELEETAKKFTNIETRNNAVGFNHGEKIAVNIQEERSVSSRISKEQDGDAKQLIEMVSLDEDIKEKITFLKMDVEGAEQDILRGAGRHIKEEHPKLAVCIYHGNEDLWKIARIIEELDDSYQMYIRYYGGTLYPNEIVLYAV